MVKSPVTNSIPAGGTCFLHCIAPPHLSQVTLQRLQLTILDTAKSAWYELYQHVFMVVVLTPLLALDRVGALTSEAYAEQIFCV